MLGGEFGGGSAGSSGGCGEEPSGPEPVIFWSAADSSSSSSRQPVSGNRQIRTSEDRGKAHPARSALATHVASQIELLSCAKPFHPIGGLWARSCSRSANLSCQGPLRPVATDLMHRTSAADLWRKARGGALRVVEARRSLAAPPP